MIRECTIVALEGTHGAGKSALAHALTAELKARHINVACVGDVARRSPFVEATRMYGQTFTIWGEVQLLAAQVAEETRMARHHEVLICDKSVASILGYSTLLEPSAWSEGEDRIREGVTQFCHAYSSTYDLVVFCHDAFDPSLTADPYRPRDPEFQDAARVAVLQACNELGMRLVHLPKDLSLQDKVSWLLGEESPLLAVATRSR